MDERIRKRRRSVRWQRSRGRRTILLVLALLVLATVAFVCLRSTDVFAVRRVTAVGAERVTQEQLAAATASTLGKSLLSLSTDDVKDALLALPYVESVQVIREFPDTLEIRLEEHRPVARLQTVQGDTWLVSDEGTVLEDSEPALLLDLPLVVSEAATSIAVDRELPLTIRSILPLAEWLGSSEVQDEFPPIARVVLSTAGCAALVFEDGGEVRLGAPTGWREKLQVAADVVRKCAAEGRTLEYVDVSVVDRVAVKAK